MTAQDEIKEQDRTASNQPTPIKEVFFLVLNDPSPLFFWATWTVLTVCVYHQKSPLSFVDCSIFVSTFCHFRVARTDRLLSDSQSVLLTRLDDKLPVPTSRSLVQVPFKPDFFSTSSAIASPTLCINAHNPYSLI